MHRTFNCLTLVCLSMISLSMSTPVRPSRTECPTITVDCPTNCPEAGETFTVTANVTGVNPTLKLSYNWSLSNSTITAGQGTPTITCIKGGDGETVTATVEVG